MAYLKFMSFFYCFDLEYNDLKTELKDYLKRFADEGTVSLVRVLIRALYVWNKVSFLLKYG